MKTKLIETEKDRVLIVDLPADVVSAEVYNKEGLRTAILVYDVYGIATPHPIENLPLGGKWLLAGLSQYEKDFDAWQAEEETVFKNPFLFFELKEKR